jgi:hypothetical protein
MVGGLFAESIRTSCLVTGAEAMSFRVRLFGCGFCIIALVGVIAVVQNRAADTNNPQPQLPQTAADTTVAETAAKPDSSDTVYLDLAAPSKAARQTENAIRKAIEKSITAKFDDTPLKDAVAHIGKQCGAPTGFNVAALEEEGISLDEPVTLTLEQPLPANAIFALMLEPLGLRIVIEDELLKVTTEINAEERQHVQLYDLRILRRAGFKTDALAEFVQQETSGPWMNTDGTGGMISALTDVLAIYTTEKVHAEIKILLDVLERIATGPEKSGAASLHLTSSDRKVYLALSRNVSADFRETPLKDVIAFFAKRTDINAIVNEAALSEEGIDTNEPVTIQIKNVTLKSALMRFLEPLGLTYIIEDGVLKITTEICAEEKLTTFTFNVRDFSDAGYPMDMLIKSIQSATSGPWLDVDGTGGTIDDTLPGFLIIRQTWGNLEEAAFGVGELRAALKKSSPDGKLPKVTRDPKADGLTLKQYDITSLPIEDVRDAIPKFVAPDSWKSAGGKGDLAIIESKIYVRQSRDVHKEIKKFLADIGEGFGAGLGAGSSFFSIE